MTYIIQAFYNNVLAIYSHVFQRVQVSSRKLSVPHSTKVKKYMSARKIRDFYDQK